MKTARFSKVVEECGKPETHLALMKPAKDRALQKAVKEQRVMTAWQDSVGTKADRGKVGFEPGSGRQFLIFPKSLRAFTEHTVFGIKYDLLDSRGLPKNGRVAPKRTPRKLKAKRPPKC